MWESCPCIIHLFSSFPSAPMMSFSVNIISTIPACMEMLFCNTFWEVLSLLNPDLYQGLSDFACSCSLNFIGVFQVFQGQLEM